MFFIIKKDRRILVTAALFLDSYMFKSENFALTFSVVWLLVRAVTGGAIPKAFGIWQKPNTYSCEHSARTNEPEAKQKFQISLASF
jgi:hypothetical protein